MSTPIADIFSRLFAQRLATLRGARSKAAFARHLGIAAPVYHRYEAGRLPAARHLAALAKKCGVEADWLIGRDVAERAVGVRAPVDTRALASAAARLGTFQLSIGADDSECARRLGLTEKQFSSMVKGAMEIPPTVIGALNEIEKASPGATFGTLASWKAATLKQALSAATKLEDWNAVRAVSGELSARSPPRNGG